MAAIWNWLMAARCSGLCSRQSSGAVRNSWVRGVHRGPIEQQTFRQPPLGFGREAKRSSFSALTMARSRPRLGAVIQKTELTTSRAAAGKPEGDVRDSQHGLGVQQVPFTSRTPSMVFHRRADVVGVAGGAGEHQRIDDDIFGRDAVLGGEQFYRTVGPPPACAPW